MKVLPPPDEKPFSVGFLANRYLVNTGTVVKSTPTIEFKNGKAYAAVNVAAGNL